MPADAATHAARWCAAARALPGRPAVLAFGTRRSMLLVVGATHSLRLQRYAGAAMPADRLWEQVGQFCEAHAFVAGYLGFDAVWPDAVERPRALADAVPTLQLWEPQAAVSIESAAGRPVVVSTLRSHDCLAGLRPAPLDPGEPVSLAPLDGELQSYGDSVAAAIAAIRRGDGQRLTLARRIPVPADVDLLASFAAPPADDAAGIGRSFYVSTEGLEMAGHSPELLGSGHRQRFACHKLSGTGPRDPDPACDARLRVELLASGKVLREHALSIESTHAALAAAGAVEAEPMRVVDRPGLRHLLTTLTVTPRPEAGWATILRAILPAGAQPRLAGLQALARHEPASRGAYYGIVGVRLPDGRFEFAQVLRTLFRDHAGVHACVGAAVTADSTVAGECDETRLKRDDIVARRISAR